MSKIYEKKYLDIIDTTTIQFINVEYLNTRPHINLPPGASSGQFHMGGLTSICLMFVSTVCIIN